MARQRDEERAHARLEEKAVCHYIRGIVAGRGEVSYCGRDRGGGLSWLTDNVGEFEEREGTRCKACWRAYEAEQKREEAEWNTPEAQARREAGF